MKFKQTVFLAAAILTMACTKVSYVDRIVEVPSYPDLEAPAPDTVVATHARIQFYGAYSETVDRWYLTLFENDGVQYVHEDDEYLGRGNVIVLCMQTAISKGTEKDIPVIAGHYSSPSTYSDLQAGQYEFGYDYPYDHPYKGIRYATYGTYMLNLDGQEYIPRYASDGWFDVRHLDGGTYEVVGMLVDTDFRKHYFKYTGKIEGVTEWNYYFAPNSSLNGDVRLTRTQLPKMEMRRTELPFGKSKNIDVVRVYLTSSSVNVGPQVSYGLEDLSGTGAVMYLEMVVEHGAAKLPEGTYQLAPRVDGGYDGAMLTPLHFKEGMPNRFTNREGSWYFNLADSGLWTGDYARIHDGKVTVSYVEGSSEPVISAELTDGENPSHKTTIDWK